MGGQQSVATLKKQPRTQASVVNLRSRLLRSSSSSAKTPLACSPSSTEFPPPPTVVVSTFRTLDKVMNSPRAMVNRSFRRTNASPYPYPRTHTTLMVLPSVRPIDNALESTDQPAQAKPRPPLNRAIPTIPESRSNESIMTQASERREDGCLEQPANSVQSLIPTGTDPASSQAKINGTAYVSSTKSSLVIENRMAHNLATKTATREVKDQIAPSSSKTNTKSIRPEPPKSPLISVAHSVRSRLTKLGNRFGHKSDPHRSSIRGSSSLMSMRNPPCEPSTSRMLKSTSMDGKPNAKTSSIPIRTNPTPTRTTVYKPVNTASASLRVHVAAPTSSKLKSPSTEKLSQIPASETKKEAFPIAEECEQTAHDNLEVMDTGQTPVDEPCISGSTEAAKAKENKNPQTVPVDDSGKTSSKKTSMIIPSSKVTSRMTTAFLTKTQKKSKTDKSKPSQTSKRKASEPKETKASTAPAKPSRTLSLPLKKSYDSDNVSSPDRHSDPADSTMIKKSFIPLMASAPRRTDHKTIRNLKANRDREAPLAECESSRVENSPAVEFPPTNFDRFNSSPAGKRRQRKSENVGETIFEEDANGNLNANTVPTAKPADPSEDQSISKLISPTTTSTSADTNKGLIDDEIKDQPMLIGNSFALIDDAEISSMGSSRKRRSDIFDDGEDVVALGRVYPESARINDDFVHDSALRDGLDYELGTVEEQLAMISLSSSFSRPKSQGAEQLSGKNGLIYSDPQLEKAKSLDNDNGNTITIVDYESSCKDLAHIKQQLVLLKNIFDNELNVGELLERNEEGLQQNESRFHQDAANPRQTLTIEQLTEENDALRRQLLEKDKIIENLRAQLRVQ